MRTLHMTLAYISILGFGLRLAWSYSAPDMLKLKVVRILPHVNDTALLLLGLSLAWYLPDGLATPWLLAKLIGLVGYILFGVLALRGQGTQKTIGAIGALLCVGYILLVAYSRSPTVFF